MEVDCGVIFIINVSVFSDLNEEVICMTFKSIKWTRPFLRESLIQSSTEETFHCQINQW